MTRWTQFKRWLAEVLYGWANRLSGKQPMFFQQVLIDLELLRAERDEAVARAQVAEELYRALLEKQVAARGPRTVIL